MNWIAISAILGWLAAMVTAVPFEEPIHALPMRRLPLVRDLEHPIMAFQRHQNAAVKRLHAMAGTTPPSDADFLKRTVARRDEIVSGDIGKRMWFPATADTTAASQPEKRDAKKRTWFSPAGIPAIGESDDAAASSEAQKKRMWIPEGGVPGVEVTKTKRQRAPPAATTTVTASGSNAAGFSRTAFQALTGQNLLNSTSELVAGGLPYIIEFNDIGYLIEVPMGTPSQNFLILADTGSGDTWVHSTDCQACGDHLALGADTSSTFRLSQTQWSITYGSGAAAGLICADTMTIAGMTLTDHIFGLSEQFTADTVPFDGLMGLSFSTLSNQRALTPIDALKEQGEIQQTVLGIALGRAADGENNGELVFGNVNAAKLDAATTQTIPVSSANGHWQVDLGAVNVDGNAVATARQAILDTGTSLMVAPEADAQAFHAQIPGARALQGGMFSIPCTTDTAVTLTFGQAAFQIDPRDMLFQPMTNDLTGQCISSLSAGNIVDDQTWLLGDSFLKNVYMATNVEDKTVSLSGRADVASSSSSGQGGSGAAASAAGAGAAGAAAGKGNGTQAGVGNNAAVNPSDVSARSDSSGRAVRNAATAWAGGIVVWAAVVALVA